MSIRALTALDDGSSELTIREFLEADREVLRGVFLAARLDAFVWMSPEAHRLDDFDEVTQGEWIAVALWCSVPVGFASVWEPDSFLHSLFVHPAFQRRGVGTALLKVCERHFSSQGTLKCLEKNRAAQRFYLAHGWRVVGGGVGPDGPYILMGSSYDDDSRPKPQRGDSRETMTS